MANEYCSTHDKVFPEGEYCEACGPESRKVVTPVATVEYCAVHDRTYPKGATCMGCDPSVIERQNYEAMHPVVGKPKYNHCAEHDQIFEGDECPAGHKLVDPTAIPVDNASTEEQIKEEQSEAK